MNHEVDQKKKEGEDGVTEMGDRNGEDWSHWAEKEKERGVTDMMKEREKERKRNIILIKRERGCYKILLLFITLKLQ